MRGFGQQSPKGQKQIGQRGRCRRLTGAGVDGGRGQVGQGKGQGFGSREQRRRGGAGAGSGRGRQG